MSPVRKAENATDIKAKIMEVTAIIVAVIQPRVLPDFRSINFLLYCFKDISEVFISDFNF